MHRPHSIYAPILQSFLLVLGLSFKLDVSSKSVISHLFTMTVHASTTFDVLSDTRPHDHSLNAFMVSTTRGFLPRADPVIKLPVEFDALESILSRMPIKTLDGSPGLLADCRLGSSVVKDLPDLTDAIEKYRDDLPLINALYRDYSFLASAYLLEPCMFISNLYFNN